MVAIVHGDHDETGADQQPQDDRVAGYLGRAGSRAPIVVRMDDEPLHLVGAHEIRDLLGVSRQRVYQLAGRSDFPRPIATLAQGKIWLVNDIEAWIDANRTRPRARQATSNRPGPCTEFMSA
jgi:prophage regulatory protein